MHFKSILSKAVFATFIGMIPAYSAMASSFVFITGGTSPIGMSIAKKYLSKGIGVVVSSRSVEKLDQLKNTPEFGSGLLKGVHCSLSSQDGASECVESAIEKFPNRNLQALVNNAGTWSDKKLLDVSEKDLLATYKMISFNFFITQSVVKHWVDEDQKGSVINIGSDSTRIQWSQYPCTTHTIEKMALNGIGNCVATEFAGKGIRNINLSLGAVSDAGTNDGSECEASMYPLGHMGTFEQVANVVYACTDENTFGFCTGTDILINGGAGLIRK